MNAENPDNTELRKAFDHQRRQFGIQPHPPYDLRKDRLNRLLALTENHADEVSAAISADFGHRSAQETQLAEILLIAGSIKHARRSLRKWMRTRRARTALHFLPGSSRIIRQPLGVVGVVAPWNYPYQLTMGPTVSAIAAGNRVMIKPSELTPRFSALLKSLVARYYSADEITVVTGGADVGEAFCQLPFDHLVFTGSTAVGRSVAQSAARNLTPVTLELGGKSPAIIDADCAVEVIAPRLAIGKLWNAGQTCIAPDYVLVHESRQSDLVDALRRAVRRLFPTLGRNPDYTSVVDQRHFDRLSGIISDATEKGARVERLTNDAEDAPDGQLRMAPILLLNVRDDMRVMREEIFGPILPILSYQNLDEAIHFVNSRDRPLALYWFGHNPRNRDRVLHETISGGVTINDCIWHFAQEDLPFGGVGASGSGVCHGEWGFRALSKEKPVFTQRRLSALPLLYPPYGRVFSLMLKVLRRLM